MFQLYDLKRQGLISLYIAALLWPPVQFNLLICCWHVFSLIDKRGLVIQESSCGSIQQFTDIRNCNGGILSSAGENNAVNVRHENYGTTSRTESQVNSALSSGSVCKYNEICMSTLCSVLILNLDRIELYEQRQHLVFQFIFQFLLSEDKIRTYFVSIVCDGVKCKC